MADFGDNIARLPAVKYIADHHKHVQQHLWTHTYFKDYAKNCLRDTNVIVRGWDEEKKFKERLTRMTGKHLFTNMASHMTKHAFYTLVNTEPDIEHLNYLKPDLSKVNLIKFNLPKNYVVVCTGFTAPVREFLPQHVNAVTSYIKSKGYDVVFLGQKTTETGVKHIIKGTFSDEINFNVGLNLVDKTDLFEATKIIAESKCIVGLDCGLLHVAGCTDAPIVGGFTTVKPAHRMPVRNNTLGWNYFPVVPPESLACRFCQSNMTFTHGKDFKLCYYDDYLCVKQLTSELYVEQLEKVL